MICPNCGTNNPDGTRFCSGCGVKIDAPAQPAQPANTQQQPVYQQQVFNNAPADPNAAPMKTSEWFWMMLVLALPIAGFICTLVWAFGSNVNQNRKNFCRATLMWVLVSIAISIVVVIICTVAGVSLMNSY